MIDHTLLQNTVHDTIYKATHIASGSFSDIILLYGTQSKYIMKQPTASTSAHTELSYILQQYTLSHQMYLNSYTQNHVKSYGVLQDDTTCYHIQEYILGSLYKLYEYTPLQIVQIAQHLGDIHSLPPANHLHQDTYKDSLNHLYDGPEGLCKFLQQSHISSPSYCHSLGTQYQTYCAKLLDTDLKRVCVSLHGDMSENNIIFTTNGVRFVDFGYIAYGEASIDVSIFRARLVIVDICHHHDTDLKRSSQFIGDYISYTQNTDVMKFLQLGLLYVGCLCIGSNPDLPPQTLEYLYNYITDYTISQ